MFSKAMLWSFAKAMDMNECDAPELNKIVARLLLIRSSPIRTSGSSSALLSRDVVQATTHARTSLANWSGGASAGVPEIGAFCGHSLE